MPRTSVCSSSWPPPNGSTGAGPPLMPAAWLRKKGACNGPNPTDRGRPVTKHHVLVDRNSLPVTLALSTANVHESCLLEAMLDAIRPVHTGRPGRPRRRPIKLHADKGYGNSPAFSEQKWS